MLIRSLSAFLLCVLLLQLTGCGLPIYGVANRYAQSSYRAKPASNDSTAATFVAARVFISDDGYQPDESFRLAQVECYRAAGFKNLNLAAGGWVYGGTYRVDHIERFKGTYTLGGIGAFGDINYNLPLGKAVDWRIVGLRNAVAFEDGAFARFRSDAVDSLFINDVNPSGWLYSITPFTELLVKTPKVKASLWLAVTVITDVNAGLDDDAAALATVALNADFKRLNVTLQYHTEVLARTSAFEVGLGWRLPQMRRTSHALP